MRKNLWIVVDKKNRLLKSELGELFIYETKHTANSERYTDQGESVKKAILIWDEEEKL